MSEESEQLNQTPLDPPFYNVMPRAKGVSLSAPRIQTQTAGIADSIPSQSRTGRSKKKLLIGGGLLIILVAGGIGAYLWFFSPTEDPVPIQTQANLEDQTPIQPEGVTTPHEWQMEYFGEDVCNNVAVCGDKADPDTDGLSNKDEHLSETDPQNPDTDGDKLADGDEVHVFGGNPTQQRTANNPLFTDADDARGGFDSRTGKVFTDERLLEVKENIQKYKLHQPSLSILENFAAERYGYTPDAPAPSTDAVLPPGTDTSPQAVLDRDTQRLSTIKKVGAALLKYKAAKGAFPVVPTFQDMVTAVKSYNLVATNYTDPINTNVYIYGYNAPAAGQNFTLTYYSETQKQQIKYDMDNALKDTNAESANLNDQKRMGDLESIWMALLLYSSANTSVEGQYVFPSVEGLRTALIPNYISSIPRDPKTNKDYTYAVNEARNSFTLSGTLENPVTGATKITCTEQEECQIK